MGLQRRKLKGQAMDAFTLMKSSYSCLVMAKEKASEPMRAL